MKRPFKRFSETQNDVWRALYARQWPQVQQYAAQSWLQGVEKIGLTADHIPDFAAVDQRLQALVGWELVSTDVQYSSGQDWFQALARASNFWSPNTSATCTILITRRFLTFSTTPSDICPGWRTRAMPITSIASP